EVAPKGITASTCNTCCTRAAASTSRTSRLSNCKEVRWRRVCVARNRRFRPFSKNCRRPVKNDPKFHFMREDPVMREGTSVEKILFGRDPPENVQETEKITLGDNIPRLDKRFSLSDIQVSDRESLESRSAAAPMGAFGRAEIKQEKAMMCWKQWTV